MFDTVLPVLMADTRINSIMRLPYPWTLADPRRRPKRIAKKIKARCGWKCCLSRGWRERRAAVDGLSGTYNQIWRLTVVAMPTRRGNRAALAWEGLAMLGSSDIQLARTDVGLLCVSTVYLPIHHDDYRWETMVFDSTGSALSTQLRALTRAEALRQHAEVVDNLTHGTPRAPELALVEAPAL